MTSQVLVTGKKYEGKYVALRSFGDNTIVAYGRKPDRVVKQATKKGAVEPVLVFVPKPAVNSIL